MLHNRILVASALAVMLAGCKDGETDTDTDPPVCPNSFSPFPEANETQAYYRTAVEAKLQVAFPTATLALADSAGTAVAGDVEVIGQRVVFTPTEPLAASTSYTATLTYDCGDATWNFTTSEVGTPVAGDLTGETYSLDLASGRFVKPEGVGDLIGQFLTTQVLVGVTSVTASNISMLGAIAVEESNPPEQDMCNETIPFPTASFANPYFEIDATGQSTPISVAGYTVNIDNLQLSGAFAPDASYIAGARLAGDIDTYPLAVIVDDGCVEGSDGFPDCQNAVCELAAVIGGCTECPDGSGAHCLSLEVDSIGAAGVDATLVAQTAEEACARTECAAESQCQEDTDAP